MCDKTVRLEPHLTFSSDGIQIEYLEDDSCADNKMTALHWEISNIISISCKWAHSVGHAFITLLAGSEAEIGNSGAHGGFATSLRGLCGMKGQAASPGHHVDNHDFLIGHTFTWIWLHGSTPPVQSVYSFVLMICNGQGNNIIFGILEQDIKKYGKIFHQMISSRRASNQTCSSLGNTFRASLKRSVIQKLINEVVTGSFQNYAELACSNEKLDESHHRNKNAKLELAGEFLAQRCSADELESVCTTRDGTHGTQSFTSICLNDSEGKGLHASGCMLDTGKVSMVAEQNLQEPRVCTPDEDTVVRLSSQDEKNEPLLEESNNHLNMRSCAPEDAEVLKGSSCVVADKEHKESLLVSLDDNQKVSSQAEVEAQDTMVSRCCSISENAEEVIACQEHSLQRNTDEAGDECYRPSQDVDSFMMLDTSKDDLGSNLAGTTREGDGSDLCEDMDSVRLGDMNKDVADTKHKDGLADPLTVENATNDSAKETSTTEDNINPSEKYVSSELTEGTTNNGLAGDISELKVGTADNGTTGDRAVSSDLNQGNTYQVMRGDCTNQTHGEDASQYLVADGAVPCRDDTTCSDAEMPLVDGPCREKNETFPENTTSDVKSPQPDGICQEKDIVVSGDKCVQKDDAPGTDAKRPLPDGICEENDLVVSGDKSIQKDVTHGTDMKIERHYKRRKVLAVELERQRSSSSLD